METWYTSYNRFEKKIIKRWDKRSFDYHDGHVNILKYAFRTLMFWASVKNKEVSENNRVETTIKLF